MAPNLIFTPMKHYIIAITLLSILSACQPKQYTQHAKKEALREKIAKNKIRFEKAYHYAYKYGVPDTTTKFLFQLTEYNKDGLAIYSNNYSPEDSTLNTREEYLYDQHNNDSATIMKDYAGSVTAVIRNAYDKEGNNTERFFYTAEGELDRKIRYSYDEQHYVKTLDCTDGKGKQLYRFTYTYNKFGDEKVSVEYGPDDKIVSRSELISDTDTSMHYRMYNGQGQVTHQFFNVINRKRYVTEQGTLNMQDKSVQKTVFTYDDNDFITQSIRYVQQEQPVELVKIVREQ